MLFQAVAIFNFCTMSEKKERHSPSVSETYDEPIDRDSEENCGIQVGCGNCRTRRILLPCCACGNNAKCFLFLLSTVVLIQGIVVNGFINIIITTIEKRFHLQSSETGFIAGCYDLGFLIAVPLVTYVGGRGHKPQWIGWGIFITGMGSIIFSLPHFVAPTHEVPDQLSYICDANATLDNCGKSYLKVYQAFFIIGHILHGIGCCGLFTLVITYIDANVKKSKSSVYHGIFFAASVAGPGVGFILGGALIRLYTNLGESVEIEEGSTYWIGNWWLGFLLCGIAFVLLSVPITFFPSEFPNTERFRQNRENEVYQTAEALQAKRDVNFGKRFRDVPRCLKLHLKNSTLVCVSVAGAMDSGSIIAVATFAPKLVEAIHRIPPSTAGLYFGIGVILAALASHLLGGYLVSRFNPGIKAMLKFCIGCAILALCCTFTFLITCENPEIPGVNTPFSGDTTYKCEGICGCGTELYDPVCGADGLTYLSICEANCTQTESGEMVNCTRMVNEEINLENAVATSGKCHISTPCPSAGLQIVVAAFLVFFTFLKFQPALQIVLRTVPLHQRSFAMGLQWAIMRIIGMIPLPLVLGRLLDSSCLVWEEICGKCGSCRLYNNAAMSSSMTILLVCTKIVSIGALITALLTYKAPSPDGSTSGSDGDIKSKSEDDDVTSISNENYDKSSNISERQQHVNKAFENSS